jgi:hypothetical protein
MRYRPFDLPYDEWLNGLELTFQILEHLTQFERNE